MKAYKAIVDMLAIEDVDTVFTLLSEEFISVLSEIQDHRSDEFRVINCRHEQGAALMADGYSRIADGIGVCIVGRGPAIGQTGTALKAASRNGSDVLYLVPESRRNASHDGKGFEQSQYLRTMMGSVESIRSPDKLVSSLADVFRRIRAGKGPIAVQIPIDILESNIPEDEVPAPQATGVGGQDSRIHPDTSKIEAAVDAYLDSDATKAPVIVAGQGAVNADARRAIEDLAERMNAYLVTSLKAFGYFSDHPYYLGFAGDFGAHIANEYLLETDYLLSFGCSLNHHTVDSGELVKEQTKVVHVDTDPGAIGHFTPVDVGIVGDARTTAEALRDELEEMGIDREGEFWTDRVREKIAASSPVSDRSFQEVPGTIDPRTLIDELDDVLPEDRLVVSDVGHFPGWVFDGLTIKHTDRLIWAVDFLALGEGLPTAIGATLAEENRTGIAFCGDAGLMMILQELETAVRNNVPLIVVVLNDDALGAEYHMAKKRGHTGKAGQVPAPDFAEVAVSLGAEGHTIRSEADVEQLSERFNEELNGPLLLDCKVNPEVEHRTIGGMSID